MTFEIPRNWTFHSDHVADHFDAHVREQLPWYELVTEATAHVARHYIPESGRVYDIGASTGNIGRALASTIDLRRVEFVPIEASQEMAERYNGPGSVVVADAAEYDYRPYDVAIVFLTLMFVPPARRRGFIAALRDKLRPGGAIIIVDKRVPYGGYVSAALWRLALAGKLAAGADPGQIAAKELALAGIQRPIDPAILGRDAFEWFRFGEFAGWIIEA